MTSIDEIVDVVDEQCAIVGTISKKEAHRKGLLHPTVIAEVINKKGEWLLVTQAKDRQEPGKYVSPMGGHVTHNETFEMALKREMKEELGMTQFDFKYVGKFIYNVFVNNQQENHFFIVYEVYTEDKPRLSHEASEYKYFSVEKLKSELKNNKEIFGISFLSVLTNLYPQYI